MLDWLSHHAGLIGLLFFFSIFVGVAVMLYRPGGKQRFEPKKYIPLEDEDEHSRRA